jgi:hypothetical protein
MLSFRLSRKDSDNDGVLLVEYGQALGLHRFFYRKSACLKALNKLLHYDETPIVAVYALRRADDFAQPNQRIIHGATLNEKSALVLKKTVRGAA